MLAAATDVRIFHPRFIYPNVTCYRIAAHYKLLHLGTCLASQISVKIAARQMLAALDSHRSQRRDEVDD